MHQLLKRTKMLKNFSNKQSHYNLRHTSQFSVNPFHSVYNGTESASYFWPKIWEQIPCEIRRNKFLVDFKREIKKWKPTNVLLFHLLFKFLDC